MGKRLTWTWVGFRRVVQVGDRVRWRSQSQGSWREKTGTVLAIVPAGHLIEEFWRPPKGTPPSRLRWFKDPYSMSAINHRQARAVVEVPRPSGHGADYYAPPIEWLEPADEEERSDG